MRAVGAHKSTYRLGVITPFISRMGPPCRKTCSPIKKHLDLDGHEISHGSAPRKIYIYIYISPHFFVAAIFVRNAKKNETRASLHDQLKSLRCFFETKNRICKKHGIHKSHHEKNNMELPPNPHEQTICMFIRIRWVFDQELTDVFVLWIGNLFLVLASSLFGCFFDSSLTLHQTSFPTWRKRNC